MGQLIKASKFETITKEGECHIKLTLDLNINLSTDGVLTTKITSVEKVEKEEKVDYTIPDFASGVKLSFGK